MSRRLTQPEEIDQILKEMAEEESGMLSLGSVPYGTSHYSSAYVSPYRAEYIKSHGFPDQGTPPPQ